jgi:hypothetical protein
MRSRTLLFIVSTLFLLQACKPASERERVAGKYYPPSGSGGDFLELKPDGTYFRSENGAEKSGSFTVTGDTIVLKGGGDAMGKRAIPVMFIIEGKNLVESGPDRARIKVWERR